MLDLLHYILDEDMSYVNGDHAQSKSIIRESLYSSLYNKKYNYGYTQNTSEYASDFDDDTDVLVTSGNAKSNNVKPYIPPTQVNPDAPNPFGSALRERPVG